MTYKPISTVRDLGIPSLMDYANKSKMNNFPKNEQANTPIQNEQANTPIQRREPVFSGLLGSAMETGGESFEPVEVQQFGQEGQMLSFDEAGLGEQDYSFYQDWFEDPTLLDDFDDWEDYLGFRQSMEGGFYD